MDGTGTGIAMISRAEKERMRQITDALTQAAEGRYDVRLNFASEGGPLGFVASAVNKLIERAGQSVSSMDRPVDDQMLDVQRYRNILDSLEETYFETDLAGRLLFFNGRALRDLGYAQEEFQGMHFQDLVDETNAAVVYAAFHEVFVTGRPNKGFEWEVLKKNKEIIEVESSVALLRGNKGEAVGFRGVVRDITARRQTERDLQEQEKKYREILENMEDTYLETDLRGNFTFFNDSLCRALGYSREQLQGIHYRLVTPPERVREVYRAFREIYTTGRQKTFIESRVIAADRSDAYLEFSMSLLRSSAGEPIGFCGFGRDVTEKIKARQKIQESERRLRLITDNISDIIWTMDFNLRFTYLSPSVFRVLGYTPEELMNLPLSLMVPEDTYTMFRRRLDNELVQERSGAVLEKGRILTIAIPLIHRDGSTRSMEINITFNRDEHGSPFEIVGVTRDISDRRQIEEALRDSEQRHRVIVENVNEVVWTFGMDLGFISTSPASARVTGYPNEEMVMMKAQDLLSPASFELAAQILDEELAVENSGQPFDPHRSRTLELEVRRKDGEHIWVEVNTKFNRDADGNPTKVLVVGRDITERKQAEEALEESEKRYRMIVENMQDIIWTMDLNFNYAYRSPSNIQITGHTPHEISEILPRDLLTPESSARVGQALTEELENEFGPNPVDPHRSRTLELEAYHKDGGTVWIEVTATFLRDDEGNPVEILLVARDMTDRKRIAGELEASEQRYRMIVENMSDVIMVMGLDFTEQYRSPSAAHLTGYTLEELSAIPTQEQVTPESYALVEQILMEQLEKESDPDAVDLHWSRTLEVELYHKDGGTVWVEETATFLRDADGRPEAIVLAIRNITERKQAEEEKERLEGQLIQSQKMETVGRLAGGVAHDFNNMLSVILGYVDLAKLRLVKEHPVLKDINEIEKAAVRSRDITSQLLAFSRKQIITPTVVNLNDLVVNTEKALSPLIGEDIHLKVRIEEEPWMIKVDPSQIEQILINLAVNARDAMPHGGKLTIETRNVTIDEFYCRGHLDFTPGDYVQLSVSDNGTGMDRETMGHIFEPFFTTKEMGKGTGLGMATVYGIVRQNRGVINTYSEPGHGTIFKVYLPRTTEEREVWKETDEKSITAEGGTILLVEDDPMVLEITRGMLESIGYNVIAADTSQDAMNLCRKDDTPFSLVITDVVMPAMSGKELIDEIKKVRPGIKVLFMSGYTADAIANHGILEEGIQFLQKPFGLKELARKVREVMAVD